MKMSQTPKFQPITITLETASEANALWEILDSVYYTLPIGSDARNIAIAMSNWFTCDAQLGGENE